MFTRLWRWVKVPANVFLGALLLLAGLRVCLPNAAAEKMRAHVGQTVVVQGKLYDDPDFDGSLVKVRVRINDGNQVFATISAGDADLERGDTVVVQGKLGNGFGAFSGTIYRGELVSYSKSKTPDIFLKMRNWFSGMVEKHIPEPESALALGYLLGQKRALPSALLEVLAITGLTHIVVASGANLTIITRMVRRLFGKSRRRAFALALLAVGVMVGIIGFAPSLVRAGLVSALALTAWYFGRPVHPVRLILLAAATTLIARPSFILDLGWQLSFAAFAGVLLVAPVLTRFFYGEAKPRALSQVAIETISATITTMPLLLYNFGSLSLISLLPNLLILPTIPIAMLLSFATGVLAIFTGVLAGLVGSLATLVLKYNLVVIEFFGQIEWATLAMPISFWQAVAIYGVILLGWFAMKCSTKTRLLDVNVVE
ncbi:MAG: ComEC/Rec2 family competence protein [Candidatus Nomurabacteria bacterium]|jgi:competence protein ComEC|nr:ComEC/Rec2 family competence protein [Candidatus Nomurabacteria bacterium]